MADRKAILVVSFGTSYQKTREKTIGAVELAIREAFPAWEVRRAFTSGFIIKKILREEGLAIDTVGEALRRMLADGVREVIVQPTHMMDGGEYAKLKEAALAAASQFDRLTIGAPLLSVPEDFAALADALVAADAPYLDEKTAVCLMGHGTDAASNGVYARMQEVLRARGYADFYVATVEASPSLEDLLAAIKQDDRYTRVVLQPMMVVAGDHAVNDMAGDGEDSWKSAFAAAGYEVQCILAGLGENADVQQMYVRHVREAMDRQ